MNLNMFRQPLPILFLSLTLLIGMAPAFASHATFYNDHAKGWHWYEQLPIQEEDKEEKEKPKKEGQTTASAKKPSKPRTPTEIVAAYKKELERRLHQAWLHPTSDNVRAYQEMQMDMMNRSTQFSNTWMDNVYRSPQLDHTISHPVNQKARHIELDLEKQKTRQLIQGLSKSYGLFFFFSSHCAYCHAFAPTVKQFSKDYGWDVLAISVDGGKLDDFPGAVPDNGLLQQWDVQALPALFAVNPQTEHVIPIAYGMISIDEMETRILKLWEQDHAKK